MRWFVRLYFLTSSIDASWIPHRRSPATIQDQRMRYWNLLQKAGLPENLFVNLNISHENEFTQASFKFPSVKSKNIYYLWLSFGEQVFTVTRHAATLYNTYKSLSIRKSPQKKASQPISPQPTLFLPNEYVKLRKIRTAHNVVPIRREV